MKLDQANDRIGNLLDSIAALEQALGEEAYCCYDWMMQGADSLLAEMGEPLVRRLVTVLYKSVDKIDRMAETLWRDEYTTNELMVCIDCFMVIVNGDTSGIDTPERYTEVVQGVRGLGNVVMGSDELGFSRVPCDCCRTTLGGSRHEVLSLR